MPKTEGSTVPVYTQFFNPIIHALKSLGGSASIEELNARVAADMTLPEETLAVPHDAEHSGRSEVAYRMAWARTYLKAAGLITNSERGIWALTPEGSKVGRLDEKKVAREVQSVFKGKTGSSSNAEADPETATEVRPGSPALPSDWKQELLEEVHHMSPDGFERLCQRVLRESGFVEVRVTGRSGDNGIDGIGLLRLQEVLSFHVIFQCKRWRNPVGPDTIRDFRGAMVGRTDKGLVMTTSYFTRPAIREATRDGAPAIDLIDGEQLAALLKKLKLGVTTSLVEQVTVDAAWFKTI